MIRYKLFPFRRLLWLIPVLFLIIVYNGAIQHIIFFDANAPDLAQLDGVAIKYKYLVSMLSINNALFEYNFFQSFLFPALIILSAFIYQFLKNRYLKYLIGRNEYYSKRLIHLKLHIASLVVGVFVVLLLIIVVIAIFVNGMHYPQLDMYFHFNSVLKVFSNNLWMYLMYYFVIKSCALFMETLFICYLVDALVSFPKAALSFVFILWGSAPILYSFLPFYLVPMSNLMITAYGDISLWQVVATYLPFLFVYLCLKVRKAYEVD